MALWHCVRIPYLFSDSPTSCPDPLSFWQLSDIVLGFPFHFDCSPLLCLDPFSFWRFSSIVPGSLFISAALWHRVRIPFFVSTALRHRVQIPFSFRRFFDIMPRSPFHFGGSSASCLDPLSFRRLSDIMFESPIISVDL